MPHEQRCLHQSKPGVPPAQQHLQIMQWFIEQAGPGMTWKQQRLCAVAAQANALPNLQYRRSLQPPSAWDAHAFSEAAAHGDNDMLRWLVQQRGTRSMKVVPPEVCDGRLLLLVLEHGWSVPAKMQPRLELARGRHKAVWAAARPTTLSNISPKQASVTSPWMC